MADSKSKRNTHELKTLLAGKWRITGMEVWDKEDYDTYVKAHITINRNGMGEFKFCVVECDMNGEFKNTLEDAVFDFTFLGNDEMDETSGDGWLRTIDGKKAEGRIRFHDGDKSWFSARKIAVKERPSKKEAGK